MTATTRAWKDLAYRASLDDGALAALEPHPAGTIDLGDHHLDDLAGGGTFGTVCPSCHTCVTCTWLSTCRTCFTCSGWPC